MYLGVTLDRTLSYKQHIEKVKGKVRTRNNLLHKLANSSWGANTSTLRATALALCYSVAEYACPVWERSSHAKKSWRLLNDSCRYITGCLRPTNVDSLYVLAGIAPPGVRRSVASRLNAGGKLMTLAIPVITTKPAPSRLKSRKSFLHEVQPLSQPPQTARLTLWEEQRSAKQHLAKLPIPTSEQLAPGHKSEWKLWKSSTDSAWVWAQQNQHEYNGAMLIQQIQPVNAGPESRPCSTYWDAHFSKMNAAWKIWQLLMRRLSTVQEPGQTYD